MSILSSLNFSGQILTPMPSSSSSSGSFSSFSASPLPLNLTSLLSSNPSSSSSSSSFSSFNFSGQILPPMYISILAPLPSSTSTSSSSSSSFSSFNASPLPLSLTPSNSSTPERRVRAKARVSFLSKESNDAIVVASPLILKILEKNRKTASDVLPGSGKISRIRDGGGQDLSSTGIGPCIGIVAKVFSTQEKLIKTAIFHYDNLQTEAVSKFFTQVMRDEDGEVKECRLYLAGAYEPFASSSSRSSIKKQEQIQRLVKIIDGHNKMHKRKNNGKIFIIVQSMFNPWGVRSDYEKFEPQIDTLGCLGLGMVVSKEGVVGVADECSKEASKFKSGNFIKYDEFLALVKKTKSED